MKILLLIFIEFSILIKPVSAQIHSDLIKDTTKSATSTEKNPSAKADTLKNRTVLIQREKFKKTDSADVNLKSSGPIEKFGVVDTSDLKLTRCEFEKDAHAMVLFDRAEMVCGNQNIVMMRQKRIKIFNDDGKSEANIQIEINNRFAAEHILAVEAETTNLVNGKIEITKIDPKLIYSEHTDKEKDVILFSMPNVKAGSIIEYRYMWLRDFSRNFPEWDFQDHLPTRYSQINVLMSPQLIFSALYRKSQPFVKDTVSLSGHGHTWALSNVPSSRNEPYMRSAVDALQSLTLILNAVNVDGKTTSISESWSDVGKQIISDKEFSKPFDQNINDEAGLVKTAKELGTDDEKIAFIFNKIKTLMKWNEEKNWLSRDGIKSAWKKKSGNWGELNMVVYHFLIQAGIKAYPMLVSTRDNGMLLPGCVNIYQINKLVIYVPVDSTKYYVLDATGRFNLYNEIPFELLNSYGLCLNKEKGIYSLVFLKKTVPIKQIVYINAIISPEGTMKGIAQINSTGYDKSDILESYEILGEKKYIDILRDDDNNLQITKLKFENSNVDSLPVTQTIEFNQELQGTDDKYIFINPNLFTPLHNTPFISKNRAADIDFGCKRTLSLHGTYKIPKGYHIEALPKNLNLIIADRSITFKRIAIEQEGNIIINYSINYTRSTYLKADYPDLYAYFKKMYEMLNEQIVLKKT